MPFKAKPFMRLLGFDRTQTPIIRELRERLAEAERTIEMLSSQGRSLGRVGGGSPTPSGSQPGTVYGDDGNGPAFRRHLFLSDPPIGIVDGNPYPPAGPSVYGGVYTGVATFAAMFEGTIVAVSADPTGETGSVGVTRLGVATIALVVDTEPRLVVGNLAGDATTMTFELDGPRSLVVPAETGTLATRQWASQGGPTASRPSSPLDGESYFDEDLGIPIWFDSTNWVDATGATV